MEKVPLTQIQNLSFKSKTIPKCKVILGAICIHEYHIVVFDYFMSQTVQLPKKKNLTLFRFDIEQRLALVSCLGFCHRNEAVRRGTLDIELGVIEKHPCLTEISGLF